MFCMLCAPVVDVLEVVEARGLVVAAPERVTFVVAAPPVLVSSSGESSESVCAVGSGDMRAIQMP